MILSKSWPARAAVSTAADSRCRFRNWVDFKEKRASALYKGDREKFIRKAHNNPTVKKLYKEYLGMAGGMRSHQLLHTHYTDRSDV